MVPARAVHLVRQVNTLPIYGGHPMKGFGPPPNPKPYYWRNKWAVWGTSQGEHQPPNPHPRTPAAGFGAPLGAAAPGATGTRVAPFSKHQDKDQSSSNAGGGAMVFYNTITAMPAYAAKSVEELRWEDYQAGVKTGSAAGAPQGMLHMPASRCPGPRRVSIDSTLQVALGQHRLRPLASRRLVSPQHQHQASVPARLGWQAVHPTCLLEPPHQVSKLKLTCCCM